MELYYVDIFQLHEWTAVHSLTVFSQYWNSFDLYIR